MSFRGLVFFFVIFLLSLDLVGQEMIQLKVIGTLFLQKWLTLLQPKCKMVRFWFQIHWAICISRIQESIILYRSIDSLSQLDSVEQNRTGCNH